MSTGAKLKAVVKTASKTSLSKTSIKFTNDYSTKCFKENFILSQLVTNNNNNITLAKKHLFVIKHYSTATVPVESGSNTSSNNNTPQLLNPVQYEEWFKEEVYFLLCTPKKNGGAGLSHEEVKPLYDAGFKGTSIANIVNDIKKQKEDPVDECLESFPTVARDTIKTVVNWVDNLLKTRLYHLWSAEQMKEQLLKSVEDGGSGLTKKELGKHERKKKHKMFEDIEAEKKIVKWKESLCFPFELLSTIRSELSISPETFIPLEPNHKLVTSFGENFIFQCGEELIQTFSESLKEVFDRAFQTSEIDKQSICTYFIASAPGTGKSRLSQELRRLSIEYFQNDNYSHAKYFTNSIQILTSLKNGTPYMPKEENSLTSRMLYSYFGRVSHFPIQTIQRNSLFPTSLFDAVNIIRKDREMTCNLSKDEPLIIYLSIDEFQELIADDLLDKQVEELVGAVINCWKFQKVLLIPIFSGLSYNPIHEILHKSTSGYKELVTPQIDIKGIEEISKFVFSSNGIPISELFNNRIVYSNLKKTYGHPRTLEKVLKSIIAEYKSSRTVRKINMDSNEVVKNYLDIQDIKAILATTILRKSLDYSTIIGSQTAKYWEEEGLYKLNKNSVDNKFFIAMSWFQFKYLTTKINDEQEKNLWTQFVQATEVCLQDPETKLYDRDFEKFHMLFDMILNQCYLYEGRNQILLKDRFRGGRFRMDESSLFNYTYFNLRKFPLVYSESNTKASEEHLSHPQSLKANIRDFFDGYTIVDLNNGEKYFLSYQEKGTKLLDVRDFSIDRTASSMNNVNIPEKTGNTFDKNRSINIMFFNMILSKGNEIAQGGNFLLFAHSPHNVKTKNEFETLNENEKQDSRSDFEIYFGSYIYDMVFSYFPKSINVYDMCPHMVSRLFGVSKNGVADKFVKELAEGAKINNMQDLTQHLKTEPLYDVLITFDKPVN